MTSPTAQLPFGMVQWGPDTHVGEWFNYAYEDSKLLGFSMTHISGAGCRLFNDIPMLPWIGEVKENPGIAGAYSLSFTHTAEHAQPGYYAVTSGNGIRTELTASLRSGMARFTFPANVPRTLLLETGSSSTEDLPSAAKDIATIQLTGSDTAAGTVVSGHFCGGGPTYILHFAMQFSQPFAGTGGWDTAVHPSATSARGHRAGAWVTFDPGVEPLLVKVALSYVSIDNARANLNAEISANSEFNAAFDRMHAAAQETWSQALSKIDVTGGTADQRQIFYTSLYHTLLSPNIFNDSNGDYLDMSNKVRHLDTGETQYTNFSDWDTIRNVVQLQSLLYPNETSQMMQSLVRDADQNGMFPRWTAANHPHWVMSGDAPAIMLADAYAFGARGFDTASALRHLVQAATVPSGWWDGGQERQHLEEYLAKGYISLDSHHDVYAATATLDFNNADFAVSRLAAALGDDASAKLLLQHAQFWRNLFDKDSRLIRPRESDGRFLADWDPAHLAPRYDRLSALGFEEGSTFQYTYTLPFNYAGLIQAMGGRDAAISQFDKFFEKVVGWNTPNFTTTNEPDFGDQYVYDWLAQPWKTQDVVSRELQTFTIQPNGLPGNDDLGATSGLYVFDALGLYPVIPGVGGLAIGTPLFRHARMRLGKGQTIDIVAEGKGIHVQSVVLNGRRYTSTWLPLTALKTLHNTLIFHLGEKSSTIWGTKPGDAPPSFDIKP